MFGGELGRRDPAAPRQRVPFRDDGHHLVGEQRPQAHAPVADRVDEDGQVDAAVEQRLDRPIGRVGGDVDGHARVLALKGGQQRTEPVITRVALRAHADVGDHPARGFEHPASGRGQHHSPSEADEERRVDAGFDVAELMTEGGLGEKQPLGRLGHAAGVRNPGDQPEMANLEVHGRDPNT